MRCYMYIIERIAAFKTDQLSDECFIEKWEKNIDTVRTTQRVSARGKLPNLNVPTIKKEEIRDYSRSCNAS